MKASHVMGHMSDSAGTPDQHKLDPSEQNVIDMMLKGGGVRTVDSDTIIEEVKKHVSGALESGYEYNTTLEESDAFLRKRILSRLQLVVMYVDLVGSTKMTLKLPEDKVAIIISAFAQEMARVITQHNGRVLKFVGDAVIGYYVADENSLRAAENSVTCGASMIDVIKRGINPILGRLGYPEIRIKVGIDFGTSIIVRYGADKLKSYVDILGPAMNIASKIQSHARPNQILIGQDVYSRLHPTMQDSFKPVVWSEDEWNYMSISTGEIYRVYEKIQPE